ncbi:hypothetical protein HYU93_00230 [Candidatus Daviesbacteria bacterium]|nr:hypothetical protein [Candidatus Daviesbacteria bacterium]
MKLDELNITKKQIIIALLLLIGLLAGVYLVQVQQVFKSRAASEINTALNVTDEQGNQLEYQGNNTYKTNSLNIRIGIKDLEQLK